MNTVQVGGHRVQRNENATPPRWTCVDCGTTFTEEEPTAPNGSTWGMSDYFERLSCSVSSPPSDDAHWNALVTTEDAKKAHAGYVVSGVIQAVACKVGMHQSNAYVIPDHLDGEEHVMKCHSCDPRVVAVPGVTVGYNTLRVADRHAYRASVRAAGVAEPWAAGELKP